MVVLVPANSLALPVTVNPEMCWSIGVFPELDAIMVQSLETAKRRSREVKREGKEKSCCVYTAAICKGAAYAGFKVDCRGLACPIWTMYINRQYWCRCKQHLVGPICYVPTAPRLHDLQDSLTKYRMARNIKHMYVEGWATGYKIPISLLQSVPS